ncbi:Flagellar biosynthesis protein FliO [hydrothermal vent metagenome]|uniref:Flagellar biosynthesis protein FliO n=1 Tax=hydrothermal vent metagenome TaxID=652676 RepID=A0A3B0YB72_9ZZZZ
MMPSFTLRADEAATAVVSKTGLATLPASQDPIAMTNLWQLTLGMLAVLALILLIAWLLKRSGGFQMASGGGLRVLGGLSMGARERVVLIQVGDTQLLLGVAPGRVQTLHVLDQPLQHNTLSGGGFAEQLSKVLKKNKPA